VASQTATGACPAGSSYWDIGVRGDTGPASHGSGFTLNPRNSVLTDASDYGASGTHNTGVNPLVASQYCNGSRIPPECTTADGCFGAGGFNVPPGISDAIVPNPVFSLMPTATVDEGNNWINMTWGPLTLTNPSISAGTPASYGGGPPLGNYSLAAGSPAIDYISTANAEDYQSIDFFGNPRPDPGNPNTIDVGAVEFQGAGGGGGPGTATVGFSGPSPALTTSPATYAAKTGLVRVGNTGTGPLTFATTGAFTVTKTSGPGTFTLILSGSTAGTCTAGGTVAAGGSCTLRVNYTPPASPASLATPGVAHVTVTDTGAATTSQNSPNFNGN